MNRIGPIANVVSALFVVALVINGFRKQGPGQTGMRGVARRIAQVVSVLLVVGSIITELRKPELERTWEGKLLGVIPYDFRFPSPSRARAIFWNANNPNILVPTFFGVGWSVNLYPIFHSVIGV